MNFRHTIFSTALICSLSLTAGASTTECKLADNHEVSALFERWNESLKTGDSSIVARNYDKDSVLLPTLSGKIRLTDAERIDYFDHFLQKKPVGKIDTRVIKVGCNYAVDTGNYTFTFEDNSVAKARYTFTYAYADDQWKITSHHSSLTPP